MTFLKIISELFRLDEKFRNIFVQEVNSFQYFIKVSRESEIYNISKIKYYYHKWKEHFTQIFSTFCPNFTES